MFFNKRNQENDRATGDAIAIQGALDKVQAMIWFDMDGTVLDANAKFLDALGYQLDEIKGQHHRIFVDSTYASSPDYRLFWDELQRGAFHQGEFRQLAKDGSDLWIEASYNPVFDDAGTPIKVVKFAIDITAAKIKAADDAGQLQAISKSQAVIEFALDGTVLAANDNFLKTLGYSLAEIKGKHHKMFADPDFAASPQYREFWESLAKGKFQAGEYLRIGKGGRHVWLQASYNPVFDLNGTPIKVVKYATDVTDTKVAAADASGQITAISRSQAVIEFDLDGNILTANNNFLSAMGYRLQDVQGKHHRMFISPDEIDRQEYAAFWKALKEGKSQSSEFKRRAKGGREVWIRASYNPIFDPSGKPYKIVKYATETTETKQAMDALVNGLNRLAEGDLTIRLPDTLTGDFAGMQAIFNDTVLRLEQLVQGILESAEAIAEDTNSIAAISLDLATRGERQAANVEETFAAMEEISASLNSTAENAKAATTEAESASQHAQQGGNIVTDAVNAMVRIEASTTEIGKIVEVIEGISFQTNLLALNAGVEAARAGDAGRGFAVVASEVRALAHRASESASDISNLISRSNKEVKDGSGLVNSSGDALTEIVSGVTAVVGSINDILTTSQEQASSITEVTQAVSEIDKTTQHTAALAEESAAAATQLAERASDLRELVSFFRYNSQSGSANVLPFEDATPSRAPKAQTGTQNTPLKKVASAGYTQDAEPATIDSGGWSDF